MTSITPMFPGWHRKLYGRRPVRPGIEMRRKAVEISSLCLRQAKDLFGDLLATELLEKVPGFRNRSRRSHTSNTLTIQMPLIGTKIRTGIWIHQRKNTNDSCRAMTFPVIDTMPMKTQNIDTIDFDERGDGGHGVLIVRQCGEQVAICLSLEENGDNEALVDREVAERLIKALEKAVGR